MYYSKQTDRHGNTTAVQIFATRAGRDIACEAFGFSPIKSTEARPYIARDETADKHHISYAERDTNVMNMHLVFEYWEDEEAFDAARESGEFN